MTTVVERFNCFTVLLYLHLCSTHSEENKWFVSQTQKRKDKTSSQKNIDVMSSKIWKKSHDQEPTMSKKSHNQNYSAIYQHK